MAAHGRHRPRDAQRAAAALGSRLPRADARERRVRFRGARRRRQRHVASLPDVPAIAALSNGSLRARADLVPQLSLPRRSGTRSRLHRGSGRAGHVQRSISPPATPCSCCAPGTASAPMRAALAARIRALETARRAPFPPLARAAAVLRRAPRSRAYDHRRLSVVHRLGTRHVHRDARADARARGLRRRRVDSHRMGRAPCREGMLPNRFPDRGETPEYNAVDASLWYVVAVARIHRGRSAGSGSARLLAARDRRDPGRLRGGDPLRHSHGRRRRFSRAACPACS